MANYRKSFNLRNGVQVDDDNFIVNANGLVGIGTTIPKNYLLSVYGDTNITGLITAGSIIANNLNIGVVTSTKLNAENVSASSSVTGAVFYGSASGLTGIYAIAVDGWYVSSGSISTTSNVGIGTTLPNGNFQVGTGVTINSSGNATYLGVVTAYSFSGFGTNITNINASNISSGTLSNSRLPSDINISGVVTAYSFSGFGTNITNINASNISSGTLSNSRLPSDINISGVVTATSGFSGNVTGNVIGNVTGNVTGNVIGNLTGTATTAQSLTGTPNISVGVVTASSINSGFATVGIATIFTELDVGIGGTALTVLNSGRIGIGTALPTSDVQVRKSNGTLVEVISDSGQSRISIGQSVGVGKSTAVLRFGSESKTFDIINNDTGNINLYLHAGPSGVGTGRFSWLYGQSNAELASLTYDGNFGIGITNPTSNLHVFGTSTVTGNANFGSNVTINGTLSATSLNLSSISANLVGNVYATSGISTFNNLRTVGNILVSSGSSIGLGTDRPSVDFDARNKRGLFGSVGIGTTTFYGSELLGINGSILIPAGNVGIGTTYLNPAGAALQIQVPVIDLYDSHLNLSSGSVGFSTYEPKAVFDFGNVGSATTRPVMVVPNIGDSTRNGIGQTPSGSIIFNTNTLKFQGYTGVAWTDFH
jgi:hypothetical protein